MSDADVPALFACMCFAAFFALSVAAVLERLGILHSPYDDEDEW